MRRLSVNQRVKVYFLTDHSVPFSNETPIDFGYEGEVIHVDNESVLIKNTESSTDAIEHQQWINIYTEKHSIRIQAL